MNNQPYSSDPRMNEYQEPTEYVPYQGQSYQQPPYQGQSYQQPYQGQPYGNAVNNVPSENIYGQRQYQNNSNAVPRQTERSKEYFSDISINLVSTRNWITALIYFILGVLEVVLALRFIFRLLGANQTSSFIQFLYGLSGAFVGPFNGIFNDQTIGNGSASVFEVSTLIAMLVYALIGWGLVSLVRVLLASGSSGR
jgi:YGGT family